MIDLAVATTAIGNLTQIFKNLVSLSGSDKGNAQVQEAYQLFISLQANLMSAQNEITSLLRDKDELEGQLKKMKEWARDKERYALVRLEGGGHAYALKEAESLGQPPHYLCPNCFDSGKKSIFYSAPNAQGFFSFVCPSCQTKTPHRYRTPTEELYAP